MTDNANKPEEHANDRAQQRPDKVSEKLSKESPEVNTGNLRAAQRANPNRTETVSPDGKPRFSISGDERSEKQSRGAQEKAYKDAGLGDPHKLVGKSEESKLEAVQPKAENALEKSVQANAEKAKEAAAKVFQSVYNSGVEALNETNKFFSSLPADNQPTEAEIQKLGQEYLTDRIIEKPIAIIAQNTNENNPFRKQEPQEKNDRGGDRGMGALEAARKERQESRDENYHRDIAAQLKTEIRELGKSDKFEQPKPAVAQDAVSVEQKIVQGLPRSQVEHPESAPIQIPKINAGEVLRSTVENTEIVVQKGIDIAHEKFREVQLSKPETWQDLDVGACRNAIDRFPELRRYGVNENVIAGIVLNELVHRSDQDLADDAEVRKTGTVAKSDGTENGTASIGPAQMQIQNIRRLVSAYPSLDEFKVDPCRAALDPDKAPLLVAAYLQEKVDSFKAYDNAHPKEPTPKCFEALLYTYNPDVVSRRDVASAKLEPNDYRKITDMEKAESALTHHRALTLSAWKSENYPRNLIILQKSGVVADIKHSVRAVRESDK